MEGVQFSILEDGVEEPSLGGQVAHDPPAGADDSIEVVPSAGAFGVIAIPVWDGIQTVGTSRPVFGSEFMVEDGGGSQLARAGVELDSLGVGALEEMAAPLLGGVGTGEPERCVLGHESPVEQACGYGFASADVWPSTGPNVGSSDGVEIPV